jgi:hypothetical protein
MTVKLAILLDHNFLADLPIFNGITSARTSEGEEKIGRMRTRQIKVL